MRKDNWFHIFFTIIVLAGCSFGFVPTNLQPVSLPSDTWTKPGVTEHSRRSDWIECGGRSNGYLGPTNEIDAMVDSCMIKKGYRFTDDCSYRKYRIACGGIGKK